MGSHVTYAGYTYLLFTIKVANYMHPKTCDESAKIMIAQQVKTVIAHAHIIVWSPNIAICIAALLVIAHCCQGRL